MHYRLRTLMIVAALTLPLRGLSQEKLDPADQLKGEWDIVGTTHNGEAVTVIGTTRPPAGRMKFENDKWTWASPQSATMTLTRRYRITGPGEIDFVGAETRKARYELNGDRLLIIWGEKKDERPINFDALKDPQLRLYELRKVK